MILGRQKPFRGVQLNRSHPLAQGLVGCWIMNEGGGNLVYDLSGNGINGTLINNAAWSNTEYGSSIIFPTDGGTDRINLGSISSAHPLSMYGSQKLSLVSKIYFPPLASQTNFYPRIFDKSDGANYANGYGINFNEDYNSLWFIVDGIAIMSSNIVAYDTWMDLGCVYDYNAATRVFYIDGVVNTDTIEGLAAFPSATTNAAIGNWNHTSDRQWDGDIVFVHIWNRILSPAEIAWLHIDPYAMFRQGSPVWSFYVIEEGGAEEVFPIGPIAMKHFMKMRQ